MTQEDLLKRIKKVDYLTINKMSYEVIAKLTQDFKSLMVKELLKRGQTNEQQRVILKTIKRSYKEWFKNENGVWSDIPGAFKYPQFLNELQVDIECGLMITDEEEADNLEERMDDYMAKHTMTKEDIDKAISDAESNTVPDEKSSETIAALEERIKELEAENERLKQEKEELKEIVDTPLGGIEADSKVGLTEILKLMENDGANFIKHNNKTIAAKALKMMTGRSESACKQIFSSPLSPTYSGHKKKISELNDYLQALGMKTLL